MKLRSSRLTFPIYLNGPAKRSRDGSFRIAQHPGALVVNFRCQTSRNPGPWRQDMRVAAELSVQGLNRTRKMRFCNVFRYALPPRGPEPMVDPLVNATISPKTCCSLKNWQTNR